MFKTQDARAIFDLMVAALRSLLDGSSDISTSKVRARFCTAARTLLYVLCRALVPAVR